MYEAWIKALIGIGALSLGLRCKAYNVPLSVRVYTL
jgi:hypothetical protein